MLRRLPLKEDPQRGNENMTKQTCVGNVRLSR